MKHNIDIKKYCRGVVLIYLKVTLALLIVFIVSCNNMKNKGQHGSKIVIEADVSKYFYWELKEIFIVKDEMTIQYTPFHYISSSPILKKAKEKVVGGKVKWILFSNEPICIRPPYGLNIILNPGDSIHISYLGDAPIYTGSNEAFLRLLNELMKNDEKLSKPEIKNSINAATMKDFMEWNKYVDSKLAYQMPIIDSYKDKISALEYEYYKADVVNKAENDRVSTFISLLNSVQNGDSDLSLLDLNKIWDSTQCKFWRKWLGTLSNYYGPIQDVYTYNRLDVRRKFGFDSENDSIKIKELRTYLYYLNAKQKFKGLLRERLLAFILDEQTLTELGPKNHSALLMLKDYYSQPGFSEYKHWVKELEQKAIELAKK